MISPGAKDAGGAARAKSAPVPVPAPLLCTSTPFTKVDCENPVCGEEAPPGKRPPSTDPRTFCRMGFCAEEEEVELLRFSAVTEARMEAAGEGEGRRGASRAAEALELEEEEGEVVELWPGD
jgi:hypothetical protein